MWIVDAEKQIQIRDVEVLRTERDNVIIGAGLVSGDRVCTSLLAAAINGMRVRVLDDEESAGLAERVDPSDQAIQ